jgi:hypothetical protein
VNSRLQQCRAHFQEVRRRRGQLAADWKSGKWSIRQLATREHLGQDSIRCILHEAVGDNAEYERIRTRNERASRRRNMKPFRKGNVPWIAGKHVCNRADLKLPFGTKRIWKHKVQGSENKYVRHRYLKIRDDMESPRGNWIPYAVFLWEREHGPVPEGHFVIHANRRTLDDRPENLILATRADTGRQATAAVDVQARARKSWEKRWLPQRIEAARARKQAEIQSQWEAKDFEEDEDEEVSA